jgi:hypothetical protein
MNNSRALTLNKTNILVFTILLGMAGAAPLVGNQLVTGTIVNATLLIAVAMLGVSGGLIIAIVPSTIALATGLLPVVLAPMLPFIMVGNILLVLTFGFLKNTNYWLGAVTGAVLKFGFLTAMIGIVAHLLINQNLVSSVAYMLSWPQLVTALAGSLLAYGFLRVSGKGNTR